MSGRPAPHDDHEPLPRTNVAVFVTMICLVYALPVVLAFACRGIDAHWLVGP